MVAGVDVPTTFEHLLKSEPELATAVAAIKTLILVLERCSAKTLQELIKLLKEATEQMKTEVDCSACSVTSGCELFLRFITLAARLEEEVHFYFSQCGNLVHFPATLILREINFSCFQKVQKLPFVTENFESDNFFFDNSSEKFLENPTPKFPKLLKCTVWKYF